MKKLISIVLVIILWGCVSTKKEPGDGPVEIIEEYHGMITFGLDPETWEVSSNTEPLIIRDQESYYGFIDRIPELEMTPMNPAPPSKDPLLKRPPVDFNEHMMIVILSHDANTFISLSIEKAEIREDKMVVTAVYEIPDPMEIQQKVIDYGLYNAVVVRRFDGEIVFQ